MLLSTFVLLTKKPLCIDSRLVNRVDRVSTDGVHTAYACQAMRKVEYDEKLQLYISEISRKVAPLEGLLLPSFRTARLTVLQGMRDVVRVQNGEIFLSEDRLVKSDDLERSLIQQWLRQNLEMPELEKSVIENSTIDLIQFAVGKNALNFELRRFAWPMSMLSMGRSNLNENLQGFLSALLIQSYLELSLKERQLFVSNLLQYMKGVSMAHRAEFNSNIENIDQATEQLQMAKEYFSKLHLIGTKFEQKLQAMDINFNENILQVDYLFEIGETKFAQREEIEKLFAFGTNGKTMAVQNHDEIWVFGKQNLIPIKAVHHLKAHQYVLIDCETPDYLKIQRLSKIASKLLYVNKCQDIQKLNFARFFYDGIEGFAKENLSTSFMQIHLASLRQVWTDEKINPLSQVASGSYKSEFFQKTGWKNPTWDDSIQAYRSHSVVQSIDLFRN